MALGIASGLISLFASVAALSAGAPSPRRGTPRPEFQLYGRPAPRFPHIAHAPRDFGIHLEDDRGFCVDTDSGRVTKDMVVGPDTTVELHLSRAELDTLYTAFVEWRLFDLPEPNPGLGPPAKTMWIESPSFIYAFRVRAHGHTKHFWWNTANGSPNQPKDAWDRLWRTVLLVERFVMRCPEYVRLPAAQGGYE
jgi:hypothetical protein